jgi:hypothetical protein
MHLDNYSRVAVVRQRCGDVLLQVDANQAYSVPDARHLARLDAFLVLDADLLLWSGRPSNRLDYSQRLMDWVRNQ